MYCSFLSNIYVTKLKSSECKAQRDLSVEHRCLFQGGREATVCQCSAEGSVREFKYLWESLEVIDNVLDGYIIGQASHYDDRGASMGEISLRGDRGAGVPVEDGRVEGCRRTLGDVSHRRGKGGWQWLWQLGVWQRPQ